MSDRASARLALGFSSVAHTYSHLFMVLYPTVVLALEPVFHLPYGDLVLLAVAGNVLFGACALPAGWLGDRWSAEGMMTIFFVGTGAAAILTGLAATPLMLAVGLALIGAFAAIYHPVGIAWLVRVAVNRGRALGVNGVFGSLGTAGAALVAGILTELVGWRAAFIVPGIVCVATGVGFALAVRAGRIVAAKADR
ncbi:MAG: MFS transporter, partial [Alphaproteobacteria bacterium]